MDEEQRCRRLRWRIHLKSSTDQLASLRARLRQLLRPLGLDRSALHDVVLSTHEAVVNGMVHGNCLDPSRKVGVSVEIRKESLVVEVTDEGAGFDWRSRLRSVRQSGVPPEALEGRGLLLMSRLMDGVCYNEAGNVVRLAKRRTGGLEARE